MKRCPRCKETKPLELFPRDRSRSSGRYPHCKICISEYKGRWLSRPGNKERVRVYSRVHGRLPARVAQVANYQKEVMPNGLTRRQLFKLRTKFGLSADAYFAMLSGQKHRCATCRKPFPSRSDVHVDHCHTTGRVRGLLCDFCNRALGLVMDNPATLKRMIAYLRRKTQKETGHPRGVTGPVITRL